MLAAPQSMQQFGIPKTMVGDCGASLAGNPQTMTGSTNSQVLLGNPHVLNSTIGEGSLTRKSLCSYGSVSACVGTGSFVTGGIRSTIGSCKRTSIPFSLLSGGIPTTMGFGDVTPVTTIGSISTTAASSGSSSRGRTASSTSPSNFGIPQTMAMGIPRTTAAPHSMLGTPMTIAVPGNANPSAGIPTTMVGLGSLQANDLNSFIDLTSASPSANDGGQFVSCIANMQSSMLPSMLPPQSTTIQAPQHSQVLAGYPVLDGALISMDCRSQSTAVNSTTQQSFVPVFETRLAVSSTDMTQTSAVDHMWSLKHPTPTERVTPGQLGPAATMLHPTSTMVGPTATMVGPTATMVGPTATMVGPTAAMVGPTATEKAGPTAGAAGRNGGSPFKPRADFKLPPPPPLPLPQALTGKDSHSISGLEKRSDIKQQPMLVENQENQPTLNGKSGNPTANKFSWLRKRA